MRRFAPKKARDLILLLQALLTLSAILKSDYTSVITGIAVMTITLMTTQGI